MEQIRSFIAIELPGVIKEELASLEGTLKGGKHSFVKWVAPGGIHLTLKFLGNISIDIIPKITEALIGAAQGIPPVLLHLDRLGAFPDFKRPSVIWVGVGGEVERLSVLQRAVESALSPLGFTPDSRDFSPHITLGRVREVSSRERQDFGKWASLVECEPGSSFEVRSFSLIKSRLTSDGAVYTQLASIDLKT